MTRPVYFILLFRAGIPSSSQSRRQIDAHIGGEKKQKVKWYVTNRFSQWKKISTYIHVKCLNHFVLHCNRIRSLSILVRNWYIPQFADGNFHMLSCRKVIFNSTVEETFICSFVFARLYESAGGISSRLSLLHSSVNQGQWLSCMLTKLFGSISFSHRDNLRYTEKKQNQSSVSSPVECPVNSLVH